MQFLFTILFLVVAGVASLFIIKNNDASLLSTFAVVIIGFFFAVSRIAKEKDSK